MRVLIMILVALASSISGCGTQMKATTTDDSAQTANDYIDSHTRSMDVKYKENFVTNDNAPVESGPVIVAFSLSGVHYSPELVSWGDAVKNIPPGKRIVTRGEALLLWDSGALKGFNFATGEVWTGSEKAIDESWALGTSTGTLDYSKKTNVLGVIYVDNK